MQLGADEKNRPGLTISILSDPGKSDALSQLLFEQTTTIGVRISEARRKVLEREQVTVETPYGVCSGKSGPARRGVVNAAPEFDDCRRLAIVPPPCPSSRLLPPAEAAYLHQSEKAAKA